MTVTDLRRRSSGLIRHFGRLAERCQPSDRLLVERDEAFATEPATGMSNDTVREVTAGVEQGEPGFDGRSIDRDVSGRDQQAQGTRYVLAPEPINPVQHPAELAQRRQRDREQFRLDHQSSGDRPLHRVVVGRGTDEDVGIDGDLHRRPAQASAIASFMSSIETGGWPFRLSDPQKSAIVPATGSARIWIRPFGSFSISSFEPGWAPRCRSNSLRSVTWPFAVTVSVVISHLRIGPKVRYNHLTFKLLIAILLLVPSSLAAQSRQDIARRAAIHPVATVADMRAWLARVPVTRAFPPDFAASLRGQAPLFTIEMTTAPGCIPCADAWGKLAAFRARYGWQVRVLGRDEALLRSGRLGLPWVGHPVIWVRALADPTRIVPIAVGTDHDANLARNAWLAARMLTGLTPQTGLRAMAKFTGIVGASPSANPNPIRR